MPVIKNKLQQPLSFEPNKGKVIRLLSEEETTISIDELESPELKRALNLGYIIVSKPSDEKTDELKTTEKKTKSKS